MWSWTGVGDGWGEVVITRVNVVFEPLQLVSGGSRKSSEGYIRPRKMPDGDRWDNLMATQFRVLTG